MGWEQEPVTEGIFSAERTKAKAPHMASRTLALGLRSTFFRMDRKPATTKGTQTAIQPKAQVLGR